MKTHLLIGLILAVIIFLIALFQLIAYLTPLLEQIQAIDLSHMVPPSGSPMENYVNNNSNILDYYYRIGPGKFTNGVYYILCYQDTTTTPNYYYGIIAEAQYATNTIKMDGTATTLPTSTIGFITFNKANSTVLTPSNLASLLSRPELIAGQTVPTTANLGDNAATSSLACGPVGIVGTTIVF